MRALAIAILLVSSSASADEPGSRADVLFREGRAAATRGDFVTARTKFMESQRLEPAVGTLFNIADCEDHLQHLVAARTMFREALDQLKPSDDRYPLARDRLKSVESRLPRLTLKLGPRAPRDTHVLRDGFPVEPREIGIETPIDPGVHVVIAQAPDATDAVVKFTLEEGAARTVTLEPSLKPKPEGPEPPPATDGSWKKTAGIVSLGVGAVGAGVALVSWFGMSSSRDTIARSCDEATKVCSGPDTEAALAAQETGQNWRTANYVGWGLGIAGLAAGAFFLLTGNSDGVRF